MVRGRFPEGARGILAGARMSPVGASGISAGARMIRAGARGFPRVRRRFLSVVAWWRRLDARHSVLRLSPRRLPRVYTTCALECACAAAEDHQDGEDVATDEVATKLRQLAVRNITSGIVGRTTGKACDGQVCAPTRTEILNPADAIRFPSTLIKSIEPGPGSIHPRTDHPARTREHRAKHQHASCLAPTMIEPRTLEHPPSHQRASTLAPSSIDLAPASIAPRTRAHRPRTRAHRPSHPRASTLAPRHSRLQRSQHLIDVPVHFHVVPASLHLAVRANQVRRADDAEVLAAVA